MRWLFFLCFVACQPSLDRQPKVKPYSEPPRLPPPESRSQESFAQSDPEITLALLKLGQQRYQIFCSVCHGLSGNGDGIAVERGLEPPPSFHQDRLYGMSASEIALIIAEGRGAMLGLKDRVSKLDRFAIAAYVRALQLSRHFPARKQK